MTKKRKWSLVPAADDDPGRPSSSAVQPGSTYETIDTYRKYVANTAAEVANAMKAAPIINNDAERRRRRVLGLGR